MESLETLPLRCYIDHGVIHISIGQETVAFCALHHPELEDGKYKVIDPQIFALDLVREINNEEEDGSTLLTRMLDEAIIRTIGNGTEGIVEEEGT